MKPVPRRLIVEWVIKSWEDISNETLANSMKSCGLALSVDGSQDELISCKEKIAKLVGIYSRIKC